jgi:hypothetical protein
MSSITPDPELAITELRCLIKMAVFKLRDKKGAVRNWSLSLISALLKLCQIIGKYLPICTAKSISAGLRNEYSYALLYCFSDDLIMIRKAGLYVAVKLIENFSNQSKLVMILTKCLLLFVRDNETIIHDHAVSVFLSLVIKPLLVVKKDKKSLKIAWLILGSLRDIEINEGISFIGKYILELRKNIGGLDIFRAAIFGIVKVANTDSAPINTRLGAWIILNELIDQTCEFVPWKFLSINLIHMMNSLGYQFCFTDRKYYNKKMQYLNCLDLLKKASANLLHIISVHASSFPTFQRKIIVESLFLTLRSFSLQPAYIRNIITIIYELSKIFTPSFSELSAWILNIYHSAELIIRNYLETCKNPTSDNSYRNSRVHAAIFTVGELSLVDNNIYVEKRLLLILQTIAVSSINNKTFSSLNLDEKMSYPIIQAYSWLTLGKIGIVDEEFTKGLIPLLIQELHLSQIPAVKNNIIFVITDLYTKQNSLTDTHLIELFSYMKNECNFLRKNTMILLARLISTGYIKCRGEIFHQITLALVDKFSSVRLIASNLIREIIKASIQTLTFSHLLDIVFKLTNCTAYHKYSNHLTNKESNQSETLEKNEGLLQSHTARNFEIPLQTNDSTLDCYSRRFVYHSLLGLLKPEQIGFIIINLSAYVLLPIVEEQIILEGHVENLLLDTLWILSSTFCNLTDFSATYSIKTEINDIKKTSTCNSNSLESRTKGVIAQVLLQRGMIDSILPSLYKLRNILMSKRHPRSRDVNYTIKHLQYKFVANLKE